MFIIDQKNRKIKLTRGDTATMLVQIFDIEGKEYEIKDSDVITFTLRKNSASEVSLTKVAIPSHHILFEPNDTSELIPGLYKYDLQLTTAEGGVYTIIQDNYFELLPEITR